MNVPNIRLLLCGLSLILFGSNVLLAQTAAISKRNNPYSPSPAGKIIEQKPVVAPIKANLPDGVFSRNPDSSRIGDRPLIAQRTVKIVKKVKPSSLSPSEIYKVGVGDVLFVSLKNSTQGSRYCTVRPDGTIDFPLAGDDLVAAGQTTDALEETLKSGITLFPDPQLEVSVRQYGSHKVAVSGLVENPGDKNLQREAMPLYTIRSAAVVSPKATTAIIKRAPLLKPEAYDLHDASTDSVLVYPGNSVEFTSDNRSSEGYYYITGNVNSTGQKELTEGITLYQALIASGEGKSDSTKATIRRKNDKGLFSKTEYNLRSIKEGKTADPALESGDVIEIRK